KLQRGGQINGPRHFRKRELSRLPSHLSRHRFADIDSRYCNSTKPGATPPSHARKFSYHVERPGLTVITDPTPPPYPPRKRRRGKGLAICRPWHGYKPRPLQCPRY